MASQELTEIYERVAALSPQEQRELLEYLRSQFAETTEPSQRRSWNELAGVLPYPALGEDAQAWISRNRAEDDEHRQQQLPTEYHS